MNSIGKYQWAKKSNGLLTNWEKLQIINMAVKSELSLVLEKFKFKSSDLLKSHQLLIPESQLISKIFKEVEQLYSPALLQHCIRTYHWGHILASTDQVHIDLELLYLASLLHDLGLTDSHIHHAKCGCFAVYGAEQADLLLDKAGASQTVKEIIFEAISAHLNPIVLNQDFHDISKYINQGAFLDVTGKRLFKISPVHQKEILTKHSRDHFLTEIMETMKNSHHPDSRAGFMQIAFLKMVHANPLDNQY
ncbi:HD domain-containing protein [Acinetobacter bereziniae]|uniref:HD domain-containing protein n=1 Tax=Acinetobacter bereziniae TaxID=106648 RepID=UPI0021CFF682|nr:HD domain-containing protein [Acinetobacter bereziniae]MCU4418759.1 HD domain-containing protein [Acinetobacter bereziniae]